MISGQIQETSFHFFAWVSFNSIPGEFTLISCLLIFFPKIEFCNLFVYGFGYFLLSVHLFIPSLYNFRVFIICVIDLACPMDCDNQFEKSRLRNEEKINVTLQNLRCSLQEVGSL